MSWLDFLKPKAVEDNLLTHPWAKADNPDRLIASAIMRLFVEDFDKWMLTGNFDVLKDKDAERGIRVESKGDHKNWDVYKAVVLRHIERKISVQWGIMRRARDNDNMAPWEYFGSMCAIVVDPEGETELNLEVSNELAVSWRNLSSQAEAARKAAAEALLAQQLNERKWNMAERLLGMKRNDQGALVPAYMMEEEACPDSSTSSSKPAPASTPSSSPSTRSPKAKSGCSPSRTARQDKLASCS